MKTFRFALIVVLCGLVLSACGPSAEQMTATVVMAKAQTETAAPTFTLTPTSTITLTPTITRTFTPTVTRTAAPTATPASLGNLVKFLYIPVEVTAMWVQTHSHIVPGGKYYYYSKAGRTFVEMGVLITNTGEKPVKVKLSNILLIDPKGTTRVADFGVWKTVDIGVKVDPAGLKIPSDPLTGDEEISLEKDTYLRLFFYVTDKERYIFRVLNSPDIAFELKK